MNRTLVALTTLALTSLLAAYEAKATVLLKSGGSNTKSNRSVLKINDPNVTNVEFPHCPANDENCVARPATAEALCAANRNSPSGTFANEPTILPPDSNASSPSSGLASSTEELTQ